MIMTKTIDKSALLKQKEQDLKTRERDINRRAKALEQQEKSLQTQQEALEQQREEIARQEKNNERERQDLERERKELKEDKKQSDVLYHKTHRLKRSLEAREREIQERELDAKQGFQAKRTTHLEELNKELRERREEAQRNLDAELKRQRELAHQNLNDELAQRREQLDKDLRQYEADTKATLRIKSRELSDWEESVQADAKFLEDQRTKLLSVQTTLKEDRTALQLREKRLKAQESFLQEERANLDKRAEELASEKIKHLQFKLEEREQRVLALQEDLALLQARLDTYEDWQRRFGERTPEDILKDLRVLEGLIEEKDKELLQRPTLLDKQRLKDLEAEQQQWQQERSRLSSEITQLRTQQKSTLLAVGQLEEQRDLYETEKRRRQTLNTTVDALEEDIKRLQGIYDKPVERAARTDSIETPIEEFLRRRKDSPQDGKTTELSWLDNISDHLKESGIYFPKRLLYAFHTSLKTAQASPLTVLAGVSGTGKSLLPRAYAHFGGLHFIDLPVRADWDSPHALFGYFNAIDNQYNATELIRALVQASKSPRDSTYSGGFDHRMLLVLLDEMNLAHVELYFSDMLSKLEARREAPDQSLSIDLGAGMEPYKVPLTPNVLWTGTMNQDATTKSLSDKVHDRSNIIFFPRPTSFIRRTNPPLLPPAAPLQRKTWESWIQQENPFSEEEIQAFKLGMERINGHLEKVGRALGHRIWQATEDYMLNYPSIIALRQETPTQDSPQDTTEGAQEDQKTAQDSEKLLKEEMRRAFEDQIVQKVMPKLRGIETRGDARDKCLDPIREELASLELNLDEDFELALNTGYGQFIWNSAQFITRDDS